MGYGEKCQGVVEFIINAEHLGNGEGAAYYGNSGNNFFHYPVTEIESASLCT